jgi:hypothetical protein
MTGIEIRSDARVVRGQFIHRTGVIIGETAIVEDDVALDRRITLPTADKEWSTHQYTIDRPSLGRAAKSFGRHQPGQGPQYWSPARWGCGVCLTRPLLLLAFSAALSLTMAGGCWMIPKWTMILLPIKSTT